MRFCNEQRPGTNLRPFSPSLSLLKSHRTRTRADVGGGGVVTVVEWLTVIRNNCQRIIVTRRGFRIWEKKNYISILVWVWYMKLYAILSLNDGLGHSARKREREIDIFESFLPHIREIFSSEKMILYFIYLLLHFFKKI